MTVRKLKLYLAVAVAVVCGVLVSVMKPAAVIGEDEVREIMGVKIHKKPSQAKLEDLGVASWPTWEGGPGQIPWTFSQGTETMYLLQGKVKVSCQGTDFEIGGGDLVVFPKGMTITWNVLEAVKKHYNLDEA